MAELTTTHSNKNIGSTTTQEAGCARLAAVAPPASCDIPALRIMRLPEVVTRVGLKRASIYLHISKGIFPKPIPLGPRAVGWLEHEIDAWLAARVAARGKKATSESV